MKEDIRYYSSEFQKESPLRLQLSGISYGMNAKYRIKRTKKNVIYVFEYVEYGRGMLCVNGEYFYPSSGDIYIAPAYIEHEYSGSDAEPWTKHWLNLYGPLVRDLLRNYGLEEKYFFPDSQEIGKVLVETVRELKTMKIECAADYTASRLLKIIQLLSQKQIRENSTRELDKAEHIRRILAEKIFLPPLSIAEIGKAVNLSPPSVNRIFRNAYGISPYTWLLEQKIKAAEELFLSSHYTIREVANMLSFHDEYYFARLFRKKTGISPGRYKLKN